MGDHFAPISKERYAELLAAEAALAAAEAARDHARRELALQQGSFAAVMAERDQARSAVAEHRIAYTALTGERDAAQVQARANADTANLNWQRIEELQGERDAAEQRATRLAALEAASRAWASLRKALLMREPLTMQRPEYAAEQEAAMALLEVIAALVAPPGEGA